MAKRTKRDNRGTMLDLWRPPRGAGEAIGCLASTYTFNPGIFDEQCLARFLEIESDPDREDLSFLLERESRLGSVYAGVLVDFTQAGVEHSLRWDVLPVRIPRGKQHAKLTLLAWTGCIRLIVASANITEPGYRSNFEVASAVDFQADECDHALLESVTDFLQSLLGFVPGSAGKPPDVTRAADFLSRVGVLAKEWQSPPRSRRIRQTLACSLPGGQRGESGRSAIEEFLAACRRRGGAPHTAWVASPFFDTDPNRNAAANWLCRHLARDRRRLYVCVPGSDADRTAVPRLAAPRSLLTTPGGHRTNVTVEILPETEDKERRPWHAKMIGLFADPDYTALMIGSSNFTVAGLGLVPTRNAEANLVTVVDEQEHAREAGLLTAVWPQMQRVEDPQSAEWAGSAPEEETDAAGLPVPAGFLGATYRAGDVRELVIRVDPASVPADWEILAPPRYGTSQAERMVLAGDEWRASQAPTTAVVPWHHPEPPAKLLVCWDGHEAFMPVNVEDQRSLPAPPALAEMTAEEMLAILAASDPAAALRVWARHRNRSETGFDADQDAATDLDPLRRHDLSTTFLHRVRRRARTMGLLRLFIERPALSLQAVDARLTGLIGIEPLALKIAGEFETVCGPPNSPGRAGEALLTLADLLIVLGEVKYRAAEGAIPARQFNASYKPFVRGLATRLDGIVRPRSGDVPEDTLGFWRRVVEQSLA